MSYDQFSQILYNISVLKVLGSSPSGITHFTLNLRIVSTRSGYQQQSANSFCSRFVVFLPFSASVLAHCGLPSGSVPRPRGKPAVLFMDEN